jgi:hypothetical protein
MATPIPIAIPILSAARSEVRNRAVHPGVQHDSSEHIREVDDADG